MVSNCMFKKLLIVASLLISTLLGVWAYLYYTLTIGDTWGLLEKLEKSDSVVSVKDYKVYEGNAFFTLALANGGSLTLGGVGNQDLVEADGIIVEKVNGKEIFCSNDSLRTFTVGISASEIQSQYLQEQKLINVQALIKNYKKLDELFSRMPLKFNRSSSLEKSSVWTCSNQCINGAKHENNITSISPREID